MSVTIQQGYTVAASGGVTDLGNKTTTSSNTQSLTSLTLTNYKFLRIVLNAISMASTNDTVDFNGVALTASVATAAETVSGFIDVDLSSGRFVSTCLASGAASPVNKVGASGLTTASTSVTLTSTGGNFDAGSFDVYGYA